MKQHIKSIAIGAALARCSRRMGCGSDDDSGPLGNVDALIILQRPTRNDRATSSSTPRTSRARSW